MILLSNGFYRHPFSCPWLNSSPFLGRRETFPLAYYFSARDSSGRIRGIAAEMANASAFWGPSVPSLKRTAFQPAVAIQGSGLCSPEFTAKRVFCSSAVQGADKQALGDSPTESRSPRLVSRGCKLIGSGSALPSLQVSNDDLAKIVDTSDGWISVRTGICNRRVLSGKDSLTSLAVQAARKALEMAQVEADDVDLVLMCTSTPEDLFGSVSQIQKELGCKRNPLAYDITAACSGFVLGLVSAACHIRGGGFNNILVIGADSLSRYVDWTDRGTCILFGDAAGAVLVQSCDAEEDGLFAFDWIVMEMDKGVKHLKASIKENEIGHALGTNGSITDFPPRPSSYSCIQMNGKEVFRFACRCVPQSIESALAKAGLNGLNIDWLLLHQANQRIIDAVASRLEVPQERVISNLAFTGNTSAASIPLALDEAVRNGNVKSGHMIATAGFGAGLTWGTAILRWG